MNNARRCRGECDGMQWAFGCGFAARSLRLLAMTHSYSLFCSFVFCFVVRRTIVLFDAEIFEN